MIISIPETSVNPTTSYVGDYVFADVKIPKAAIALLWIIEELRDENRRLEEELRARRHAETTKPEEPPNRGSSWLKAADSEPRVKPDPWRKSGEY